MVSIEQLQVVLSKHQVRLLGVVDAESLIEDKENLKNWQEKNMFAGMKYMSKDPDLLSSPKKIYQSCQRVISLALDYPAIPMPSYKQGSGWVARYAWGKDYHLVFKYKLDKISQELKIFGDNKVFTDSVPLLERALARKTQSGFIGKNTMFIQPKIGSFFFLAEILCAFEIPLYQPKSTTASCQTCTNCQSSCPTGALNQAYTLDANLCISYLTIEHKGLFNEEQIRLIDSWLFGCDICQQVCPFNYTTLKKNILPNTFFYDGITSFAQINLNSILSIDTDLKFKEIFKNSPILRSKRLGLIRNACAVAINQKYKLDNQLIKARLNDTNPEIRNIVLQYLDFI